MIKDWHDHYTITERTVSGPVLREVSAKRNSLSAPISMILDLRKNKIAEILSTYTFDEYHNTTIQ